MAKLLYYVVYNAKLIHTANTISSAREWAKKESTKPNRKDYSCFVVKYTGDSYRRGRS